MDDSGWYKKVEKELTDGYRDMWMQFDWEWYTNLYFPRCTKMDTLKNKFKLWHRSVCKMNRIRVAAIVVSTGGKTGPQQLHALMFGASGSGKTLYDCDPDEAVKLWTTDKGRSIVAAKNSAQVFEFNNQGTECIYTQEALCQVMAECVVMSGVNVFEFDMKALKKAKKPDGDSAIEMLNQKQGMNY